MAERTAVDFKQTQVSNPQNSTENISWGNWEGYPSSHHVGRTQKYAIQLALPLPKYVEYVWVRSRHHMAFCSLSLLPRI